MTSLNLRRLKLDDLPLEARSVGLDSQNVSRDRRCLGKLAPRILEGALERVDPMPLRLGVVSHSPTGP